MEWTRLTDYHQHCLFLHHIDEFDVNLDVHKLVNNGDNTSVTTNPNRRFLACGVELPIFKQVG
jgi:hypothetical protein